MGAYPSREPTSKPTTLLPPEVLVAELREAAAKEVQSVDKVLENLTPELHQALIIESNGQWSFNAKRGCYSCESVRFDRPFVGFDADVYKKLNTDLCERLEKMLGGYNVEIYELGDEWRVYLWIVIPAQ